MNRFKLNYTSFPTIRCGGTSFQQNNRGVKPHYFKLKLDELYWIEGERGVIARDWIWWCPAGPLWGRDQAPLLAGWWWQVFGKRQVGCEIKSLTREWQSVDPEGVRAVRTRSLQWRVVPRNRGSWAVQGVVSPQGCLSQHWPHLLHVSVNATVGIKAVFYIWIVYYVWGRSVTHREQARWW